MVTRLEPDSYGEYSHIQTKDPFQNRIHQILSHLFPQISSLTNLSFPCTMSYIDPIPVRGQQPHRLARPGSQPPRPHPPLTRPQPYPHSRPEQDVYSRVSELARSSQPPKKSSVRVINSRKPASAPQTSSTKTPAEPQPKEEFISSSPVTPPSTTSVNFDKILDSSETQQPMIIFELPGTKLARGCIGGINGIGNDLASAKSQADYIRQLVGNYHIEWVHNQTRSIPMDIVQTIILSFRGTSTPAEQLQAQWKNFHEKHLNDPAAKYFQICHSQGALHVKNALLSVPKEIRNRVIVLAIAPAVIVPKSLCFNSFNYASKRDPIPYGQTAALLNLEGPSTTILKKIFEVARELISLDPHPEASTIDHGFKSPTFKAKIQEHIQEYLQQAGANSSTTA